MKKIILSLCLVFLSVASFSQVGLQGIVVEKYYTANAADHAADPNLAVGAVTYRIYIDLQTGWQLQMVTGDPDANRELKFATSASRFYNAAGGSAFASNINYAGLNAGTLMLDSWISMGAAAAPNGANFYFGIPKADDDAANQIVHSDGLLQNLTFPPYVRDRDGYITVTTPATVAITPNGISALITMLNGGTSNSFVNNSAGWFTTDNCQGPNAANKILIGQFTTEGTFEFKMQVNIRRVSDNLVEKYVAENVNGEANTYLFPACAQSFIPPTVNITAPLANAIYTQGDSVLINAHATDAVPGTVTRVEFLVDGSKVGEDLTADVNSDFQFRWKSTSGIKSLTAVATDNDGLQTTSAPVSITVASTANYAIQSQSVSCNSSDLFYVPVVTQPTAPALANVTGFDLKMVFDKTKVRPTGVIRVNNDLINSSLASYAVRVFSDSIKIALFLNGSATASTYFQGQGQVLAVEFAKTLGFAPAENTTFIVPFIEESYNTQTKRQLVENGVYATFRETSFTGYLKSWSDNQPITYTAGTSLITNIYGNVGGLVASVQPDATEGKFTYDINNGTRITILRDIVNTTSVFGVITGYDAYLTQKVVLGDPSFTPNVFQIMAMDVNRDKKVSAGDVSQIMQRAAGRIGEFKMNGFYDDLGNKITSENAPDWYFIDNRGLYGDPQKGTQGYASFRKSLSWPGDDGTGYSKNRVPTYPLNNLDLPVENVLTCPIIYSEEYQGIMVGDVDGSYKNIVPGTNPLLKKSANIKGSADDAVDKVVFDLSKATLSDGILTFPVSVSSKANVNSLDFSIQFDESKLTFKSVVTHSNAMQSVAYYNEADQTLRFTSFSMQSYANNVPAVSVSFELKDTGVKISDLKSVAAYLNGEKVAVKINDLAITENTERVRIYPNPAKGVLNVELSENANIQLLDMYGRVVRSESNVNAFEKRAISLAGLPQGIYMMKVYMKIGNEEFVSTKKVIIRK